jgi:CheY-like chemotaxis protein
VAHDFNNALSGIMGSAEILLLKLFDRPELASLAEKILKASEHAAGLTRQLLGFSRKGHLLMARVSLHEIINNTMDIVRNTIDKRISIELSLKARSDSITGDASQLHHCLLNLAINARDAMPNGGRLLISTDTMELDDDCINRKQLAVRCGRYVKVSVSDTGIGMSEEVKKHLYEPFFTTKNDGRSTGLGLAGVYGCIKNHDGALELVSDPGQGTTFSIYIPLTEDRPAEPVDIQKPDISHGSGRIFLVDDESIVRDVAGQMLRHLGYQVQFSSNGTEAVDFYKKHQKEIDLVILDMIMPGCNGREAYFRMKEANPNVKVLLSSGYCSRQEVKEAVEAGLQGFLQKPFSLSELSQKIKEILK